MTRFELSSGLRIGHNVIDADHEELIGLLNGCLDLAKSGMPSNALSNSVAALCERLTQHVGREEAIMQALGYTDLESERQEHQRALIEFRALVQACRIGLDIRTTMQDISASLLSVFIKSDMAFKGHLQYIDYRDDGADD